MNRTWLLCVLVISVVVSSGVSAVAAEIEKVPAAEDLARSLSAVKSLYGDKFTEAKKTRNDEQRREALSALVDEILETYRNTAMPADRFALLQVARQIAVYAQDFEAAIAVIDTTATSFQIDAIAMKAVALTQIGGELSSAREHAAIVPSLVGVLDDAMRADRRELVKSLADAALASAKRAPDSKRVRDIQNRSNQYSAYERAVAILEQAPDDASANLVAGKYLCVYKGDWASGVSHLALGADQQLQRVAVAELTETGTPTSVQAQIELADMWWQVAEGADGAEQDAFRARARDWYRKALPAVPERGLAYRRIQSRLEQPKIGTGAGVEAEIETEQGLPRFAKNFIGTYIYQAAAKKSGETAQAVWQFREDNEVLENGVPIAKWSAADRSRIKVELDREGEETMLITPRTGRSMSGSRDANNDTWRWELARLEAKQWEHKTESIEIFGRTIEGGTQMLTFYSNGRINDPFGSVTWKIQGNTLSIDWGDSKTTEATIGPRGMTYSGKTRQPTGFGNTKFTLPVTGRLIVSGN